MSFNPDSNKQAQEIIFSRKRVKGRHPSTFSKSCSGTVRILGTRFQCSYQKED